MDLNAIPVRSDRELYIKDRCIRILNENRDNPTEHAKQLALFVANEMEQDYKLKVFRDQEPEVMRDYKALGSDKERMAWDKEFPEWRMRDDVSEYLSKKSWVVQENDSNKAFLKGCVDSLEGTEHVLQKQKLENMVAQYEPTKVQVATIDWNN